MQAVYNYQHIVFKGFFIFLVILLCLSMSRLSYAQTPLSGTQLLTDLQNGDLSLSEASDILSQQSGALDTNFEGLLSSITDATNINIDSAATLIDGLSVGTIDQTLEQVSALTDMVDNLQSGNLDTEAINDLIASVGIGDIPPEIGEILSTVDDLGNLLDLTGIEDVFSNPDIIEALSNILDETGLPTDVTEIIENMTGLLTSLEGLEDLGAQLVADAISDTLSSVAPSLVDALGGATALTGALSTYLDTFLAVIGLSCPTASCNSCQNCAPRINLNHLRIQAHISSEFDQHRNWLVSDFFIDNILPALGRMTVQLTTTGMQQIQAIGTFFDAKHQLETQRLFQTMTAQAHKDYHPSEGLCTIGTNVRSLAASEKRADLAHRTLATRMMDRQLLSADGISTIGEKSDRLSRLDLFILASFASFKNSLMFSNKNSSSFPMLHKVTNNRYLNLSVTYSNQTKLSRKSGYIREPK